MKLSNLEVIKIKASGSPFHILHAWGLSPGCVHMGDICLFSKVRGPIGMLGFWEFVKEMEL